MREIKFRAWDNKAKEMVPWGVMMQTAFNNEKMNLLYDIMCQHRLDMNLMQYTGLKDKNGKEIYEGDIVEFDRNEWFKTAIRSKYKGIPDHGPRESVTMKILIDGNYFGALSDFSTHKTVIGNIYENPELLDE